MAHWTFLKFANLSLEAEHDILPKKIVRREETQRVEGSQRTNVSNYYFSFGTIARLHFNVLIYNETDSLLLMLIGF